MNQVPIIDKLSELSEDYLKFISRLKVIKILGDTIIKLYITTYTLFEKMNSNEYLKTVPKLHYRINVATSSNKASYLTLGHAKVKR